MIVIFVGIHNLEILVPPSPMLPHVLKHLLDVRELRLDADHDPILADLLRPSDARLLNSLLLQGDSLKRDGAFEGPVVDCNPPMDDLHIHLHRPAQHLVPERKANRVP